MNSFFLKMLETSLFTSVAAVFLMLLSQLLQNKTKPQLRYVCWVVVALCFLTPIRFSVFNLNIVGEGYSSASALAFFQQTETHYTANNSQQTPSAVYEGNATSSTAAPSQHLYGTKTQPDSVTSRYTLVEQILQPAVIVACVWILGSLVALGIYIISYMRFISRIKQTAIFITDSVLNDLLNDVCSEIGLKKHLRLAVSPVIHTPVVMGFFRSTIFIPHDYISYQNLRLMLMHEALHIKGGHMWGKLLSLTVIAVHWFNPAVYMMNRAMADESELACDAAVLHYIGEKQRLQYGNAILQTAKNNWRPVSVLVSAFGGNGKNLKRRLSAIVEQNTTKRWVAVICAAVMVSGSVLTGLAGCTGNYNGIVDPIPDAPVDLTPTDELVIYAPNVNYILTDMQPAVELYKKRYPNINVTLELIGENGSYTGKEYSDRVNSELMAGTGPDIVVVHHYFFPDIYKTMDTGVFLNLSSILEQDEDFNMEDYYQPVIDVGLYKGGRYIVPYYFNMPFMFSLQERLDAVGFDISKNTDLVQFFQELTSCMPSAMENPSFISAFNSLNTRFTSIHESGLTLIDYEHKKVLPDEDGFKAFCEAFKPYWDIDNQEWTPSTFKHDRLLSINSGDYLFNSDYVPFTNYIFNIAEAKGEDSAWVLSAMRGMDGGINTTMGSALAIRAGSTNQLNAWNFIKTALSDDIQIGTYQQGPAGSLPVRRESMASIIDNTQNQGGEIVSVWDVKWIPDVTPEEKQPIYDLLDSMTGCVFWKYNVFDYFIECMSPWFNDEKSYKECVAELKRKLSLYVDE